MQNNFTTFRPEIKGVKIEKVELVSNTYHVYGTRYDIRQDCCNRRMNIHDYRTVNIRSLGYGNRKVILHIEKQRYVCPVCGKKNNFKYRYCGQELHNLKWSEGWDKKEAFWNEVIHSDRKGRKYEYINCHEDISWHWSSS